jgi:anaerobic magnesium-protoporphyrin IX monomethyl ester cyclase
MFPGEYVPGFYRVLHKVVHKRFRIQQGLRAIKECMLHPSRFNRASLNKIIRLAYYIPTLFYEQRRLHRLEKNPSVSRKAGLTLQVSQ